MVTTNPETFSPDMDPVSLRPNAERNAFSLRSVYPLIDDGTVAIVQGQRVRFDLTNAAKFQAEYDRLFSVGMDKNFAVTSTPLPGLMEMFLRRMPTVTERVRWVLL